MDDDVRGGRLEDDGGPAPTAVPGFRGAGAPRAGGERGGVASPATPGYWSPSAVGTPTPGADPAGALGSPAFTAALPTSARSRRYEYGQGALSPLPYLVAWLVALVVSIAAAVAVFGARSVDEEDLTVGVGMLFLFAVIAAVLASFLWIRRIGRNADSFGLPLMVAAFPWGSIFLTGLSEAESIDSVMFRLALTIIATLALGLTARRLYVTKLWTAGGVPSAGLSVLLWLPDLALTVLTYGAIWASFAGAETRTFQTASGTYRSTSVEAISPSLLAATLLVSVLTSIGIFLVAIVGTFLQHAAIRRDRDGRALERAQRTEGAGPVVPIW